MKRVTVLAEKYFVSCRVLQCKRCF